MENCILRPLVDVLALLPNVDWIVPKVVLTDPMGDIVVTPPLVVLIRSLQPLPLFVFVAPGRGSNVTDVEEHENPALGFARLGVLNTLKASPRSCRCRVFTPICLLRRCNC